MLWPMHRGPVLAFEHVSVCGDGDVPVLDDLHLELDVSQPAAIVGPSGAGKTTMLRLCNRLEVPTTGRVLLDGDDLASIDPLELRRRVGMVFQQPIVFGGTVLDNLQTARPDVGDGAERVLRRVGLDPSIMDRQADDLSGGEAQRLCIGRALLTEPELMLMDEPTSSLDPDNRALIEELTSELAATGLAVMWVTHDLAQAHRVASRIVVMVDGRLATDREATEFVEREARRNQGGGSDARD
jgi:putative ABC transport system ATP-binding protein